ncbi:hypothetical protein POM88_028246 [Heracleum sosnowskyi]|uniref:Uncharacterized protein n=1 Tax=Heracleum sosnowskyi TaxID=360622 RepID=A0AAD8I942_9APIA|nr:hypothetical protein POM88_028246 [Heracleum sosnowskyi]
MQRGADDEDKSEMQASIAMGVSTESPACFYFDLDQERLETMPSPPIGLRFGPTGRTLHIGESRNHVHVTEIYASHNSLTVYEMKSDYSGWFLKYDIDLSPVAQVFPQMKEANPDDWT